MPRKLSRAERSDRALSALVKLLRSTPLTARDIAARTRCSKPTVYARLDRLKGLGHVLRSTPKRAGTRGPKAVEYFLAT